MRHFNLAFLIGIFFIAFGLLSCGQSNTANNAEVSSIEDGYPETEQETEFRSSDQSQPDNVASDELDFLRDFEGKYPFEVKLLENPVIEERLRDLLGDRYDFMKKIWNVETPIEINDGLFYAWGMGKHSGGDPSAVLMADMNKNVFFVGIRDNGQETFYAEDGSNTMPKRLQDWADE